MIGALTAIRGVLVVAGVSLLVMAVYARRAYDGSAITPFVGLLGLVGVLSIADAVAATSQTALALVWVGAYMFIPVAFAWFVVEYYGLPYLATRAQRLGFLAPVLVGIAGGTTLVLSPSMGGVMSSGAPAPAGGSLRFEVAQLADSIGLFYAGGVMLLATILLFRTCWAYPHLDTKLGIALGFIGLWPWVSYLTTPVTVQMVPVTTILAGTATGYAASALAAGFLVSTGRLFEAAPAAGTLGPETVLDTLDDLVIVVDREGRIVRVNERATTALGTVPADSVGQPVDSVVGVDLDTLREVRCVELETGNGTRHFETTVSGVTDRHGRTPGAAVVLRDVTQRRLRGQRLTVLNRVLRHNLRNRMTSIIGRAQLLEAETDYDDHTGSILTSADDLVALGERAREVENMMSVPVQTDTTTTVDSVVSPIVERLSNEFPDATITTTIDATLTAAVDGRILAPVVENVVENAVIHNESATPEVAVRAEAAPENPAVVELTVTDNGPGIPATERNVLQGGDETPLEHGSGLGLWAVYWGVTRMGGDLSVADAEPRGTVVRLRLPGATESAADAPTPVEAD